MTEATGKNEGEITGGGPFPMTSSIEKTEASCKDLDLSWEQIAQLYNYQLPESENKGRELAAWRERKIVEYLDYFKKVDSQTKHPSFEEQISQRKGKVQERLGRQRPLERINRAITINFLSLKGIKESEKFVDLIFESLSESSSFWRDLGSYYSFLRSNEVVDAIKKINNPAIALERLLEFSLARIDIFSLQEPDSFLTTVLKRLGSIPEEKFQKALREIRDAYKYCPFISPPKFFISKEEKQGEQMENILRVIENGGFSEGEKNALKNLAVISRLTGESVPFGLVRLGQEESQKKRLVTEELVAEAIAEAEQEGWSFPVNAGRIVNWDDLEELQRRGILDHLTELICKGWKIGRKSLYAYGGQIKIGFKYDHEQKSEFISSLTSVSSDLFLFQREMAIIGYLFDKEVSVNNIMFFKRAFYRKAIF